MRRTREQEQADAIVSAEVFVQKVVRTDYLLPDHKKAIIAATMASVDYQPQELTPFTLPDHELKTITKPPSLFRGLAALIINTLQR